MQKTGQLERDNVFLKGSRLGIYFQAWAGIVNAILQWHHWGEEANVVTSDRALQPGGELAKNTCRVRNPGQRLRADVPIGPLPLSQTASQNILCWKGPTRTIDANSLSEWSLRGWNPRCC